MLDSSRQRNKVLLRKWDDSFDWWSLTIVIIGGAFQTAIYLSICFTFNVAKKAGLNIGIAQAIWAINPFFVSILEKIVYSVPFKFKHIYGMSALVLCAVCVSLSEVVSPPEADASVIGVKEEKTPIWVAILASLLMPIVCTLYVVVIKHSNEKLNNASYDFTIGTWLVLSIVF